MTRAQVLAGALVAALSSVVLVAAPAQADVVTLSGVVRTDFGVPIEGMTVTAWYPQATSSPSTTTTSNGSYVIQVEQGREVQIWLDGDYAGMPGFLHSESEVFVPTTARTENLVVSGVVPVHVHVAEYDGLDSVGASVTPQPPRSVTRTSGGLNLISYITGFTCHTDALGTCDVKALRNGSIGGFAIAGRGRDTQQFPSTTVPFEIQKFYSLSRAHPLSGRLAASDGSPIAGAAVSLTSGRDTLTASDGSFEIWSPPGNMALEVDGTVQQGGWSVPFDLLSESFTLDRTRSVVLTLPAVKTFRVRVRDAVGEPVPHAQVDLTGPVSRTEFSADWLSVTGSLLLHGGPQLACTDADSEGVCRFPAFAGGDHGQIFVSLPTGRAASGVVLQAAVDDEVIARMPKFVTALSEGTSAGRLSAELYKGAEILDFRISTADVPDGYNALIGRIDFRARVTEPGGTARLDLDLLPGVVPNAMLRVDSGGRLVAVDPDHPVPDPASVTIVDGSAADLDGATDGLVTANLIPVLKGPLEILTDDVPGAAKGKAYQEQLEATGPGGPFTWSLASGSLPPGLSLSPGGVISGVPSSLGGSSFSARVTDRFGYATTRSFFLNVSTIAVTTRSVPDAFIGASYSTTLEYAGGPFPTWRLAGGSLPPGLKFASGKISGIPTSAGSYTFWVTVTSGGVTSYPAQRLTLVVRPMEIAAPSLPDAPVWTAYSQKLTTRGGKATLVWSVSGGGLPPGVVLSSAGALSGKPTTVGSYPVTIKVKDALGQIATKSFVITVTPMTITTTSLTAVKKGSYYSQLLAASGCRATLTWSVLSGTLPTGLTLSTTGRISGYPKAPGSWTFTVRVSDSSVPKNTATRTYTITVT
jgi:hypothetical protein